MSIVHGTYKGGRIELDSPVDWPEGAKVDVVPLTQGCPGPSGQRSGKLGMSEEDWPTSKEGIAALIAEWNAIEPMETTPEEQAEFEAAQKAIGEYSKQAVARQMGLEG